MRLSEKILSQFERALRCHSAKGLFDDAVFSMLPQATSGVSNSASIATRDVKFWPLSLSSHRVPCSEYLPPGQWAKAP